MKKMTVVFTLLGLCALASAESIPLESFVSVDIANKLRKAGELSASSYKQENYKPSLTPNTVFCQQVAEAAEKNKSVFAVENLYLIEKKLATSPGADIERISRILRSISALKGIMYYASGDKEWRVFYEDSHAIKSPEDKTPVPDPVEGNAQGMTVYTYQKDNRFGWNRYEYTYRQTACETGFESSNLDVLSFMLVRVVKKQELHVSLIVNDLGDSLLVYSLTQANFPAISMIENKAKSSFSARAEAVFLWFKKMYLGETK